MYRAHKVLSTRHSNSIVQKGNLICVKKKPSNCDPKKFETNKLKKGKESENNCGDDEHYC